jgi:hypothetical protein
VRFAVHGAEGLDWVDQDKPSVLWGYLLDPKFKLLSD